MAELQQKLIADKGQINHTRGQQEGSQSSFMINEEEERNSSYVNHHQTMRNQGHSPLGNQGSDAFHKVTSLADLPANSNIEEILNQQKEDLAKPFSSRVKLVIDYDELTKHYKISHKDVEVLKNYDIDSGDIKRTTEQLELNKNLRPFDRKSPFIRRAGLRFLTILVCLIYSYVCLLLLQLALFNLIFLGIEIIYLKKLYYLMHGVEVRRDYNYRTQPFKKFIEQENVRFYREKKIELVGGEQGKWIELQLPESIEDIQKKQGIEERLFHSGRHSNNVIHERQEEEDKQSEKSN